jgi:mono/diheme cytochrome c family protein
MMKLQISGLAKLFASVLLITVSFLSSAQEISTDPAAISAGEAIFNGNCKSCHRVKTKLIFDGRNIFDNTDMKNIGFDYYCIGVKTH